jgi:hypothetical protein
MTASGRDSDEKKKGCSHGATLKTLVVNALVQKTSKR